MEAQIIQTSLNVCPVVPELPEVELGGVQHTWLQTYEIAATTAQYQLSGSPFTQSGHHITALSTFTCGCITAGSVLSTSSLCYLSDRDLSFTLAWVLSFTSFHGVFCRKIEVPFESLSPEYGWPDYLEVWIGPDGVPLMSRHVELLKTFRHKLFMHSLGKKLIGRVD